MRILVNVRCLDRPLTGAQRYTSELITRWQGLVERASPGGRTNPYVGHLWEQLILPVAARGRVLFSPSNTGPLFLERQVVTIHDMKPYDIPEALNPQLAKWYRISLASLAQRALKVIAVSSFTKERILRYLNIPESKIVVVPNGVSREFQPAPDPRADVMPLRLPTNKFVLALSTIHPGKNLNGLLRAWAIASERIDPSIWLVVAGNKGMRSVYARCDLEHVPERVCFCGAPDDDVLPSLYRNALGFVHVSTYEGFGIPVLEAMACGSPVLASDVTAVPEVAGDAALLVDPTAVQAIAQGIERIVLDEELRTTLRQRGLKRAKLFSWDETARQTWNVLQSVVDA